MSHENYYPSHQRKEEWATQNEIEKELLQQCDPPDFCVVEYKRDCLMATHHKRELLEYKQKQS